MNETAQTVNATEAADILGCTKPHVHNLARRGKLTKCGPGQFLREEVESVAAEKDTEEARATETINAANATAQMLKCITDPLQQVNRHEERLLGAMHKTLEQQRERIAELENEQRKSFDTMRELLDGKAEREEYARTQQLKRDSIRSATDQLLPLLPELGRQLFKLPSTQNAQQLTEAKERSPEECMQMLRQLGADLAEALSVDQCKQLADLAKFQNAEQLSEILILMADIKMQMGVNDESAQGDE